MEEYKFSNSNLDFKELLDKYKKLNTTYSDNDDIRINIYENCNLLQDLTTTFPVFPVPSTNIRLSSFKNNYIIADIQTLDLNKAFYTANTALFTTVESETYINNINLTNIITTYFNYTNDDIYPSKKIIIKINLHKEIVDTNGSGALQINMKEIKEHFHSLFDTLELDINQYVTGKHGGLEATVLEPSGRTGGKGQKGLPGDPAINITNNDDPSSYFKLDIRTNGRVSGGFGASGGNGGNGIIDEISADNNLTSVSTTPELSYPDNYVTYKISYKKVGAGGKNLQWTYTYKVYVNYQLYGPYNQYGNYEDDVFETDHVLTDSDWSGILYTHLSSIYSGASYLYIQKPDDDPDPDEYVTQEFITVNAKDLPPSNTSAEEGYAFAVMSKWTYKVRRRRYVKKDSVQPTIGNAGSKANYSNNAQDTFDTQDGDTGTPHDGTGGAGGAKGNQGGITNITNIEEVANINII